MPLSETGQREIPVNVRRARGGDCRDRIRGSPAEDKPTTAEPTPSLVSGAAGAGDARSTIGERLSPDHSAFPAFGQDPLNVCRIHAFLIGRDLVAFRHDLAGVSRLGSLVGADRILLEIRLLGAGRESLYVAELPILGALAAREHDGPDADGFPVGRRLA